MQKNNDYLKELQYLSFDRKIKEYCNLNNRNINDYDTNNIIDKLQSFNNKYDLYNLTIAISKDKLNLIMKNNAEDYCYINLNDNILINNNIKTAEDIKAFIDSNNNNLISKEIKRIDLKTNNLNEIAKPFNDKYKDKIKLLAKYGEMSLIVDNEEIPLYEENLKTIINNPFNLDKYTNVFEEHEYNKINTKLKRIENEMLNDNINEVVNTIAKKKHKI